MIQIFSILNRMAAFLSFQLLGWLDEDNFADLNFNGSRDEGEPYSPPVMGVLKYPKSKIFFIGDANGLQVMPQPFIDNLITWMRE